MGKIQLNKDVTIVWRDGVNYKLKKDIISIVPDTLINYITTSSFYQGVVSFFEIDTPVKKINEPKISNQTIEETIVVPEVLGPVFSDEELENNIILNENKEVQFLDENIEEKKNINILKQLMNSSPKKTEEILTKKRGRPSKKK